MHFRHSLIQTDIRVRFPIFPQGITAKGCNTCCSLFRLSEQGRFVRFRTGGRKPPDRPDDFRRPPRRMDGLRRRRGQRTKRRRSRKAAGSRISPASAAARCSRRARKGPPAREKVIDSVTRRARSASTSCNRDPDCKDKLWCWRCTSRTDSSRSWSSRPSSKPPCPPSDSRR